MQAGQLFPVRTNPATQFTAALAQNAGIALSLRMAQDLETAGDGYIDGALAGSPSVAMRVRSLIIQSVENLDWELWLWGSAAFNASPTNPALNTPLAFWQFTAAMAKRIGGAGLYTYYIDGLDQPYADSDRLGQFHIMLVNRSAAAKTAGPGGAILVQVNCEPTLGY